MFVVLFVCFLMKELCLKEKIEGGMSTVALVLTE